MNAHLPKPLHGWRAFIGEVGVIVLGVLLALAAQELAQFVSARRDAGELRKSMIDELSIDRARWEATHHDVPCALKLLDEIGAWASRPGSDKLTHSVLPSFWTMHDSAWLIARASPTITAVPLKERDTLADLYFVLEVQDQLSENAENSMARVDALAKTADRTTSRNALPEAATEAQAMIRLFDNNFDYVERRFDRLGVRSDLNALGPCALDFGNRCPNITPQTLTIKSGSNP